MSTEFGSFLASDVPDAHRDCPRVSDVRNGRLEIRCLHKSKSPRVIGVVHGNHVAHRYGCEPYPGAPHEEVPLICDKCGRQWAVVMAKLREAVEEKKLSKVDVAQISRRWTFLGPA